MIYKYQMVLKKEVRTVVHVKAEVINTYFNGYANKAVAWMRERIPALKELECDITADETYVLRFYKPHVVLAKEENSNNEDCLYG